MIAKIQHIALKGITNCVPSNVEKNEEYDLLSAAERKMLISTTGIKERRVAEDGVCASDLCEKAALKLLNGLNWEADSVNALIFVSQSSDYYLPATAIILQNKLGLSKNAIAFDINLGCSGYVYGLYVLSNLMQQGQVKRAILLCGDISTNSVNYKDKSAYPLFGDSGSATALEYDETAHPMTFSMGSDGSGYESIMIKGGGTRNMFHENSLKEVKVSDGITRHELNLILDGISIFNFSIGEVPKNVKELMEKTSLSESDVEYLVLHQANKLINETIRKKLKFPKEKVPYSLDEYGNTSSGSIPLTIQTRLRNEVNDKTLILSGFGVGLSWASVVLTTKNVYLPELIEI
ncbi:3-oxoacyl-ACP synthase III family protein [Parvicella tangerina]|uniref:3-oxoacyl-[acyl-carrier-protein] synthase 3 n=1 Tax=Parvicella tangerina TaxID=2829795 RepID=A0A916NFS3_9FLAO|nr:ketoacyl-ACP synthase III [Parvicella tangerina]CAG5079146.1 3-oxoacyl-[acyl-carrier-protein] synthase 3 [Parvicella tangerina]